MPFTRINMVEFSSKADAEYALKTYREEASRLFPNAQILLQILTGPQSVMSISVYENPEQAEIAVAGRKQYVSLVGDRIRDVFFYEGDVDFEFLGEAFKKALK